MKNERNRDETSPISAGKFPLPGSSGSRYTSSMRLFLSVSFRLAVSGSAFSEEEKSKQVAGTADALRHVKKQFVSFLSVSDSGPVRPGIEGATADLKWQLAPDADVRVDGW
jgi:hypothetical protein